MASRGGEGARLLTGALGVLAGAVALALLLSGCLVVSSRTGTGASGPTPVAIEGVQQTEVAFLTGDGLALQGMLVAPEEPSADTRAGIVFVHMYPADQRSWWPFAQQVATQGYTALTFNARGYVSSHGERDPSKLDQDIEAALNFLAQRGIERVFLVGASMGGTASVIAASRDPDIAGVVALSAPIEFMGLDAREAADLLDVPTLFIAAEGDGGALEDAETMARGAAVGDTPVYVLSVSGDDHGTDVFNGEQSDRAANAIMGFLADPRTPPAGVVLVISSTEPGEA